MTLTFPQMHHCSVCRVQVLIHTLFSCGFLTGTMSNAQVPVGESVYNLEDKRPFIFTILSSFPTAVGHLGDQPVQVACPTCHQTVLSKVEYSAGLLTYLSCAGLFFCGWVGLYSYSSSMYLPLWGCAAPDVCSHLFQICFGMLSYSILRGPAQKCKTHLSHLQDWTGRLQTPVNQIWPFVFAWHGIKQSFCHNSLQRHYCDSVGILNATITNCD